MRADNLFDEEYWMHHPFPKGRQMGRIPNRSDARPFQDDELSGSVKSLDAYADSGKIHLLLATTREDQEKAGLLYTCSTDHGKSWRPYQRIDTSAPAYARGRTDFQAASGDRTMQHGTNFMGRGPLSSAFSEDGGKSWRNTGSPSDLISDGDHAFETADDKGNFHAVWLDKRSGKDKGYSESLIVTPASGKKNSTVDAKVCDCCWAIIKAGSSGHLYALY